MMQLEMERRKMKFIPQYRIMRGAVVDFAFPSKKIAIECDGDYWHANPSKYKDKDYTQKKNSIIDKEREELIRASGWTIMRFWETDIRNNVKECVDVIERELAKIQVLSAYRN